MGVGGVRSFLGSGRASLAGVRAYTPFSGLSPTPHTEFSSPCQGEPQPWAATGVPFIRPRDTPAKSLRGRRKEKDPEYREGPGALEGGGVVSDPLPPWPPPNQTLRISRGGREVAEN